MRKSLLATAAAIALIAGTGMASAEGAKEQPAAKPGQAEMHKGADTKGGAALKAQPQTTGAGASEMKSEPKAEIKGNAETKGKAEMKSGTETKGGSKAEMNKAKPSTTGAGSADKADTKAKSSTTGAGPSESSKSGEMKSGTDTKSSAQGSQAPAARSTQGAQSPSSAQGTSSSTTAQGSAGTQGASVNLTSEQKTQIRTTVLQANNAPKVSRSSISFNIGVGTVVPRTVHFVTVPDTIVRIHPAWRGYSYFIVDEEIVIIDPHTFKIVAVLTV